ACDNAHLIPSHNVLLFLRVLGLTHVPSNRRSMVLNVALRQNGFLRKYKSRITIDGDHAATCGNSAVFAPCKRLNLSKDPLAFRPPLTRGLAFPTLFEFWVTIVGLSTDKNCAKLHSC